MELTAAWTIFEEGGLVETTQWVLLAASTLLCLFQLILEKEAIGRSALVLLALFFTTLLLREVDVEDFAWPWVFLFLGSGTGRDLWLGLSWVAYASFAISRWRWWFPQMRHLLLRTTFGWALMAGCACYAAGLIFDKEWLPLGAGASLAAEESGEMAGCVFFFVSALLLVRFRFRSFSKAA